MKQCITLTEWRQLPPNSKQGWTSWCARHYYSNPEPFGDWDDPQLASAPTIGQMLEFLSERSAIRLETIWHENGLEYGPSWHLESQHDYVGNESVYRSLTVRQELCDALWERVKEVLAQEV